MTLTDATRIVLELAEQNVMPKWENEKWHDDQTEAIDMVARALYSVMERG